MLGHLINGRTVINLNVAKSAFKKRERSLLRELFARKIKKIASDLYTNHKRKK